MMPRAAEAVSLLVPLNMYMDMPPMYTELFSAAALLSCWALV